MKKQTMLEKAINGRVVVAYVDGLVSPYNKRSNLHKAITKHGYTPDDLGSKIEIAVGAHKQNYSQGFKMAIVIK